MLKPTNETVSEEKRSRYSLVIGVAKLAREVSQEAEEKGEPLLQKPVSVALNEIVNENYRIVEPSERKEEATEVLEEPAEEIAESAESSEEA